MKNRHEKYLEQLFMMAMDLEPVGAARIMACVVSKNNNIIAFGHNDSKTSPHQKLHSQCEHKIFKHAEIDAIRNAVKRVRFRGVVDTTLYVCRAKINENGEWCYGLSKPCGGCYSYIKQHNLKRVFYSKNNKGYSIIQVPK